MNDVFREFERIQPFQPAKPSEPYVARDDRVGLYGVASADESLR